VNITRGNRTHAEAEPTDGAGSGTLGRRSVLGGLAAIPVLYGLVGSAIPASAAAAAPPDRVVAAAGDLVQGVERRYNAPLLAPGTRLVLPAGIKAVPVRDYYHRPRLAPAASTWPRMRAADGAMVDASVVPERGAPTRVAVLSGFTDGWYEIRHANGRADRVTWDASAMPFLWLHGEFGGAGKSPYDRFYSLALQPMSANPYSLATAIS
jgi:hypothetical protein